MTFVGNSTDVLIPLMQITDNDYDILLTSDYIQLLSCGKTKNKFSMKNKLIRNQGIGN